MDLICRVVDAQADRGELIDHLALRHMVTLKELELADSTGTRIMGLPLGVLRRLHGTCVERETGDLPS